MREVLTRLAWLAGALVVCVVLARVAALGWLIASPTNAQAASPTATSTAASSGTWPRLVPTPGSLIRVFEPQVESLVGDTLTSRAAISLTRTGERALPVFGAVRFTAKISTNAATHTATLEQAAVTRVRMPDLAEDESQRVASAIESAFRADAPSLATERLAAAASQAAAEREGGAALSTRAPKILVSKVPAVLMLIDGKPERRALPDSDLEQVVNTPFAVIYQPSSKTYFTSNGNVWYAAPDATGPWTAGATPPADVTKAIGDAVARADAARQEVAEGEDAQRAPRGASAAGTPPAIVVSTEPAELLVFDGEPQWAPLANTGLLVAMNTSDDAFLEIASQQVFVLLAGRWFRAPSLDGPWTFQPADKLPADFASIPQPNPKAHVRASVAGTPEAQDAVLESEIPKTAAIDRRTAKLDVTYDGEPRFEAIPGTEVSYAVNTPAQVLRIRDRFYAVDQGVWFTSLSPEGPWRVADARPPEVDSIPPESPVYNTRYVYVYDTTPEYVYVGYLPGYVGEYAWGPTVVFGTGYSYAPWHGTYFYPRPYTWGFPLRYSWGWGFTWVDGPCSDFLWLGWGWGPRYHHHHHHHDADDHPGWYGPSGPRPVYRPPPQPKPVPPPTGGGVRVPPRPPTAPHNLYVAPKNLPRVTPLVPTQHGTKSPLPSATTPAYRPPSTAPSTPTNPSWTPSPTQGHPRGPVTQPLTPAAPSRPAPAAPAPAAPAPSATPDSRDDRAPAGSKRPSYTAPPAPSAPQSPSPSYPRPDSGRPRTWTPSPAPDPRERPTSPSDPRFAPRPSGTWLPNARPSAGWASAEPVDERDERDEIDAGRDFVPREAVTARAIQHPRVEPFAGDDDGYAAAREERRDTRYVARPSSQRFSARPVEPAPPEDVEPAIRFAPQRAPSAPARTQSQRFEPAPEPQIVRVAPPVDAIREPERRHPTASTLREPPSAPAVQPRSRPEPSVRPVRPDPTPRFDRAQPRQR